jgi:hypothetical protein
MRRSRLIWLAALLVAVCLWNIPKQPPPAELRTQQQASRPPTAEPTRLERYASPQQTPQQDLTQLYQAIDTFALLIKGSDPLPLGANEDLAAALKGKNRAKLAFLPADTACFNAKGQLIDRWGQPLFLHANDRQRLDLRSAGPDKQMWTQDDLHRRYDGQFITGDALNSPSLFEASQSYRNPAK